MKQIKKLFSYLVALAMVFSIVTLAGVNVHAAGETATSKSTYTLTVNNTDTKAKHIFEIYQIFKGDYNKKENEAATLSNIEWGSGVTDAGKTAFGPAKVKAESLNDSNVSSFAKELVSNSYLQSPITTDPVESGKSAAVNVSAGYYLIKDKDGSQKETHGDYTSYILKVVGDTTANTKLNVPTVVKKVEDTNDTNGTTSDWQDSADYDIGDSVPYQITGSMPTNIGDYETYKYVFTDTMSKGLTYKANTAKIKIGDTDVTTSFTENVTSNTDGSTTVTWSCDNLKGIQGVTINANTKVVVTYSAKLNENAVIGSAGNPNTVDLTYSNDPNQGGEGETGKTPEDKNIVFTYKTVVNKVDKDNNPLKGAGFTLQKKVNGTYQDIKTIKAGETTKFEFSGLDDGDYKLIESTTPSGYNTIAPIEFTITATHDTDSGDPKLTELNGVKATGEIDLGTQQKATVDTSAGSITANVVNNKGSELPETGGMGTTLLYGVGAILVAAAAAYVVMNKKHSTNK